MRTLGRFKTLFTKRSLDKRLLPALACEPMSSICLVKEVKLAWFFEFKLLIGKTRQS